MTKTKKKPQVKIIAQNKKARYNYQIIDTWEAGIKLKGLEVKAIRAGNVSLDEAWVKLTNKGAKLTGCSINLSQEPMWEKYDHRRDRLLLLRKAELRKIKSATLKGLTVVPLKIYFTSKGLAKIQIATAKGKKAHDKRKTIRDRDNKRYGF